MTFRRMTYVVLGALMLFSMPAHSQTSQCLPSPDGLGHWWPGDGDAADIQGSANGTPSTGVSFISGEVQQAFSFDGTSGFVDFDNTVGNFGAGDFTIAFWVRSTKSTLQSVISKRSICNHTDFLDIRMGATGPGRVTLELDQDASDTNYNIVDAHTSVNDGIWHCMAIKRAGPTASIFVDGDLDAAGTTAGTTNIMNTAPWTFGKSPCTDIDGTSLLDGDLDEVQVFDRALSSTEIAAICGAGSAGVCKDEDGDGYRPPDDCDETDASINPDAVELPGNFVDENCDGDLGACDPCRAWRNHGEFVRCVSGDVETLVASSVLTEEEGDALVSSAARADVGKQGFVPPECQP